MSGKNKRQLFSVNTKYQMEIMFYLVCPLLITALVITVAAFEANAQVKHLLNQGEYTMVATCIAQWFYRVVMFIFLSLATSFVLTFKVSRDVVNAFPRILRETDEVLATGVKKVIVARPEDDLANDVLKRINALIERMK